MTGYQIRYSKTSITTQAEFDAASNVPVHRQPQPRGPRGIGIPTRLPRSPRSTSRTITTSRSKRPTSPAHASPMLTSSPPGTGGTCDCTPGRCCAAHFNVTTLTGSTGSTTEGAGFTMDGSGDADRDGLSDVLIGSFNNSRAYLFLGSSNFTPTAASVTFSSAATGFGRGVAFIGDIDHDGREDLAIANRSTGVVYIYRGRDIWPMTMADTDADFTITADAPYAGSLFGGSMSRLGDFDGDGIDDFAIGAADFSTSTLTGRVTVIRGSSGFTSVTLPDTSRAIVIDGDPTITFGGFGAQVLGIGPFYSPTGGSELIVSAPGFGGASTVGRIYAFRGQSASAGVIPLSSADATMVGASAGMRLGAVLTDLGAIGTAPPQVATGNPNDASVPGATGSTYLFSGDASNGPFFAAKSLYFSGTSLDPYVLVGGGVRGRNVSVSTIGDSSPDVVVAPRNGNKIAILDGSKVSAFASSADIARVADVLFNFPAGLGLPNNSGGSLVPDVNGDGFADFAISDGASVDAGSTMIFW